MYFKILCVLAVLAFANAGYLSSPLRYAAAPAYGYGYAGSAIGYSAPAIGYASSAYRVGYGHGGHLGYAGSYGHHGYAGYSAPYAHGRSFGYAGGYGF